MIELQELIFEITRKCNMSCAHCLRGDAQNMDIDYSYINKALKNVSHISSIVFTGGEPSLNTEAIKYTLKQCEKNQISVGSFFIATNGKEIDQDFVLTMLKWQMYCSEPEYSCLALSQDIFHEEIDNDKVIPLLRCLSFFDEKVKATNYKYGLINEGRAKLLSEDKRPLRESEITRQVFADTVLYEGDIYICADGKVKSNCDTAFNNNAFVIGDLNKNSLTKILHKAAT